MRKRITNNLALKILAFLIAAFLWLVVVNIDDPVDDKTFSNIPVQVTHEEVITDNNNTYQIVDNTQEINVTVTAQRSVLDKDQGRGYCCDSEHERTDASYTGAD